MATVNPGSPNAGTSPNSPPAPADAGEWLSSAQAAARMGLSLSGFQKLAADLRLPRRKDGHRALFEPSVIEEARRIRQERAARYREQNREHLARMRVLAARAKPGPGSQDS